MGSFANLPIKIYADFLPFLVHQLLHWEVLNILSNSKDAIEHDHDVIVEPREPLTMLKNSLIDDDDDVIDEGDVARISARQCGSLIPIYTELDAQKSGKSSVSPRDTISLFIHNELLEHIQEKWCLRFLGPFMGQEPATKQLAKIESDFS